MVVKEGNLGNSEFVLSSTSSFIVSSLNTKTKPEENLKFTNAEMLVAMGQPQTAKQSRFSSRNHDA